MAILAACSRIETWDIGHDEEDETESVGSPLSDDDTAAPAEVLPPAFHSSPPIGPTFTPSDFPNGTALFRGDVIQDLSITLSDAALAGLRVEPTTQVEATLAWRDEVYTVALRLKGSASFRDIDEKPSFKIDVHEYDPEQEIDGLERLTLNNMIQDETLMREHTFYWFAARLGLPAPRQSYARVTVNGQPYGLYSIIETMDEQLVKRLFPDDRDGNLYESSGCDFTYARDWFDLEETRGVVESPDDMDDLVDAVEAARYGGFDAMLHEWFDYDAVLTYLALDMVSGNSDGYVYNHHNYFAYHRAIADDWVLLPWGMDQGFTEMIPPLGASNEPAIGHLFLTCWEDAECQPALVSRADAILARWEDELPAHVEETEALIREDAQGDPRREKGWNPDDIVDFVRDRPDYFRSSF